MGRQDSSPVNIPFEQWLQNIDRRDQDRVLRAFDKHRKGLTSHLETEFRVHRVNGEVRWVLCRGVALVMITGYHFEWLDPNRTLPVEN